MKVLYEREYSAFIAHKTTLLRFIVIEILDSGLICTLCPLCYPSRGNLAILVDFARIKYMKHLLGSMYSASIECKTIFIRVVVRDILVDLAILAKFSHNNCDLKNGTGA